METLSEHLRRNGVAHATLEPLFRDDLPACFWTPIPYASAASTWRRLRLSLPALGYWPVLLGDASSAPRQWAIRRRMSMGQVLEKAVFIDPVSWFDNRQQEIRGAAGVPATQSAELDPFGGLPRSPWPEKAFPAHEIRLPPANGEGDDEAIALALTPAKVSWQTLASLNFGLRGHGPAIPEHVAVLEYWHDRHGAEVAVVTRDSLEMNVQRPPRAREDAFALARQHYLYNDSYGANGEVTLDILAAQLLGATVWSFHWE